MYFLKAGDRIIVDMGNSKFCLEAVNLLGERIGLVSGLSADMAKKAAGFLGYHDHGQVWTCHQARPGELRPVNRT